MLNMTMLTRRLFAVQCKKQNYSVLHFLISNFQRKMVIFNSQVAHSWMYNSFWIIITDLYINDAMVGQTDGIFHPYYCLDQHVGWYNCFDVRFKI